jgi:hypothetical protein
MTLYTFSICLANDVSRKETYIARSEKALYQHLFYKLCNDYDWCNYIFIDEDIADKVYKHKKEFQVLEGVNYRKNHRRFTKWFQYLLNKYNNGISFSDHSYHSNFIVYATVDISDILEELSDEENEEDK